ncbi:hypothetical protein Ahy_A05g024108 [Arachis hypogaea]|uniref:Uncharacterized protein n=1 Tax=Arachis hypogaea TaxID=3818 RepID=A0A445D570_ARAHY|nr:hypothetical protein Ahy_A05g024108 [Arachis hypogaea]
MMSEQQFVHMGKFLFWKMKENVELVFEICVVIPKRKAILKGDEDFDCGNVFAGELKNAGLVAAPLETLGRAAAELRIMKRTHIVSASQIAFGYGGEATSFKPYRNPSSGSENSAFSELLDDKEFGKAAESRTFDENSTNPAKFEGLKVDSTVKHKQNFDRFLISQNPLSNINTSAKKRDHYYSLAEDFLEITPRKTIGELKECKEDGDYAVYGTIMGVIGGSDWFVAQCRCGTEVVLKLGSYYCEKSSKHIDLFSLKL